MLQNQYRGIFCQKWPFLGCNFSLEARYVPPQGGGRPQTKPIGLLDLVCYLMAHLGGGTPTVGVDLRHFLGVTLRGKKPQKLVENTPQKSFFTGSFIVNICFFWSADTMNTFSASIALFYAILAHITAPERGTECHLKTSLPG